MSGIDQGILFNSTLAYFEVPGFNLLGTTGTSYSIAIWVKKASGAGTIAHLSQWCSYLFSHTQAICSFLSRNDSVVGWCISFLGVSASNEIIGQNWNGAPVSVTGPVLPLNAWTHLVTSYNPSRGLTLWVNGTLVSSPVPMIMSAPNAPLFLTLGARVATSLRCVNGNIQGGQFYGIMDELRVYSRELNSSEIYALAYSRL